MHAQHTKVAEILDLLRRPGLFVQLAINSLEILFIAFHL